MQKKLKLMILALLPAAVAMGQTAVTKDAGAEGGDTDENAITFTEAQMGEDDDMSQNISIISSGNNEYASEVGYLFSPVRFRYRAFGQKYNEIHINGAPVNDIESGQFRYSFVGGLNQQTKGMEASLPFESNNFAMSAMGGSNNYNFRPASMPVGHRITLSGANRNYKLRGAYTFNSGYNSKGWAFSGNLTYRWAGEGVVEGTFYNSLSYFLGVQKLLGNHSISLVTWGNPTERGTQGASTDEMYWLANDRLYNPYWGYQDGKKRNSRVVNDYAPAALMTWDWQINETMKLTTSLLGKYGMYKSTKLNYNNSDNPQPDYWKMMPSSNYDVWDETDASNRTQACLDTWNLAYDYLQTKENRQINWDRLYWANKQASAQGADAMYYVQAKHNDVLNVSLASVLQTDLSEKLHWNIGVNLATNKGMHYQTMEDLLGATSFHNINTYAVGTYAMQSDQVQYDLNNPNASVGVGDKFGYDYNILVDKAQAWTSFEYRHGRAQAFVAGRIGAVEMQRDGKMRNGLAADYSYGKSGVAHFLDGGGKVGANYNLGGGVTLGIGGGYELRAPQASTAFVAPEINNDFVSNLKNERVASAELSVDYSNEWLHANIMGYGSCISNATEWQQFYFDDINSFSYVSLTGEDKVYYGIEWGLNFKLTSAFNIKTVGTISEAKYNNNAKVWYMSSTNGTYNDANNHQIETCYNKNMREAGTPLTALSLIFSYHQKGWFIDINGNWYDRIYLYYSPYYRYGSTLATRQSIGETVYDNNGEILASATAQEKGHGGFMLDASIGRSIYIGKGSLSINLMITNLLNNTNICTGGYEQSRSDYTSSLNTRAYKFSKNPKKYYAYGTNAMLNLAYKF